MLPRERLQTPEINVYSAEARARMNAMTTDPSSGSSDANEDSEDAGGPLLGRIVDPERPQVRRSARLANLRNARMGRGRATG